VAQGHDDDCRLPCSERGKADLVFSHQYLWAMAASARNRLKRPDNAPLRKQRDRSARRDLGFCQLPTDEGLGLVVG